MKQIKAILHGECILSQSSLPTDAILEEIKDPFVIIANSEVTGNHHVIDMKPGVEVYKSGTKRFIKNSGPTQVRCVIAERHNAIDLAPGVWEVGIQQEFDYFAMAKKNVAD